MKYLNKKFSVPVKGLNRKKEVSKCCNAPVRIEVRDVHFCERRKRKTKLWDICTKCGQVCEVEEVKDDDSV